MQTCCQHAAYVAGRGEIDDEIEWLTTTGTYNQPFYICSNNYLFVDEVLPDSPNGALATYCLQLPGKKLHFSALLAAKKFRGRGNKAAALAALCQLETAGIGRLESKESHRGTSAVSKRMCSILHYWDILGSS